MIDQRPVIRRISTSAGFNIFSNANAKPQRFEQDRCQSHISSHFHKKFRHAVSQMPMDLWLRSRLSHRWSFKGHVNNFNLSFVLAANKRRFAAATVAIRHLSKFLPPPAKSLPTFKHSINMATRAIKTCKSVDLKEELLIDLDATIKET